MKRVLIIIGFCIPAVLFGWLFFSEEPESELVMPKGMVITAINKSGIMRIEAVEKYKRTYSWNGKKKTFKLVPRKDRWNGSMGAYSGSGDREMHVVLQEGQQHFSSQGEVYPWLYLTCYTNVEYTSDGLVVAWQEQQHPTAANYSALSVEVWQVYVNGQKPIDLRGASPRAIKVKQPDSVGGVTVGNPLINRPRKINGRNYYGKALDFMDERIITPDLVEKVILKADVRYENGYTCYSGWGLEDKALHFAVWMNAGGDVVFVCQ